MFRTTKGRTRNTDGNNHRRGTQENQHGATMDRNQFMKQSEQRRGKQKRGRERKRGERKEVEQIGK